MINAVLPFLHSLACFLQADLLIYRLSRVEWSIAQFRFPHHEATSSSNTAVGGQ